MHLSPVVLLGVISITSARFAKVDRQEHHHNLGKRAAETSTAYNFDNIAPGSMKFDTPQSQIAAGAMKLATVTKQVNGTK